MIAMLDLQRYPSNLNLIKILEYRCFPDLRSFLCDPSYNKKCANHFRREIANENKQFKEIKTWISNSYFN